MRRVRRGTSTFARAAELSVTAPMIVAQTVSQLRAGVTFPPGQVVGPIGGFATIAVVAIWVIVVLLRNVSDSTPYGAPRVR